MDFRNEYYNNYLSSTDKNCFFTSGDFNLLSLAYLEKTENDNNPLFTYGNFGEMSRKLLQKLETSFDAVQLSNRMFIKKEFDMLNEKERAFNELYNCNIEKIDTNKDDNSAQKISKWISQETNKENFEIFLKPSLNTVFKFSPEWDVKFDNDKTYRSKFNVNKNNSVDVEMMKMEGKFNYADDPTLNVEVLEIPYKGNDKLTITIILPKSHENIQQVLNTLSLHCLDNLLSKMKKHKVNVHLPKASFQSTMDIIEKTGAEKVKLDIGGTMNCNLSQILSKTTLEFNEQGTKLLSLTSGKILINPAVREFLIETNVANRFVKSVITNVVENLEDIPQEAIFNVLLPENAFISEFVMEVQGKSYKSYVKEKEEAKQEYTQAVSLGKSAAHVAVSARDSNKFTVNVNVAPLSKATFLLTYEELLQRRCEQYELVLNLHPGQLVEKFKIKVNIEESRKLKNVQIPEIRSGNEISEKYEENSLALLNVQDSKATIQFEPNLDNQKILAKKFGKTESHGISGQFVVKYDVDVDPSNGEVLVKDGYFVYFYAPDNLPPLAKHVVFALDTSGSMGGRKIEQLRDAMKSILQQIRENDLVSILEFNSDVIIHNIDELSSVTVKYGHEENYYEPFYKFRNLNLPNPKPANGQIIEKAQRVVSRLEATTSTHMIGGLEAALYLINVAQEKYSNYQPMIIFLTDGQPMSGITNHNEIINIVTKLNARNYKAPIFSLSFGEGAEKSFLRELSLKNSGFSRHIYEASDASLQLQQFYKHISSPLLSNVTFKYEDGVEELTRTFFPIYFCGTDIIISGRFSDENVFHTLQIMTPRVCVCPRPIPARPSSSLERLWAYLTVKQILEEKNILEDKTKLKKALDLALKYSFVTDLTSLVVVKPDEEATAVNTENAMNTDECTFAGPMCGTPAPAFSSVMACRIQGRSESRIQTSLFGANMSRNRCFLESSSTGSVFGSSSFGYSASPQFLASNKFQSFGNVVQQQQQQQQSLTNSGFTFGMPVSEVAGHLKPKNKNMDDNMPKDEDEPEKLIEFRVDRPCFVLVEAQLDDKKVTVFAGKIYEI